MADEKKAVDPIDTEREIVQELAASPGWALFVDQVDRKAAEANMSLRTDPHAEFTSWQLGRVNGWLEAMESVKNWPAAHLAALDAKGETA